MSETLPARPRDLAVKPLRPYMCWAGDPEEGAVLTWAYKGQEARKLAFPAIAGWTDARFLDVRARLLKAHPAYYETLKLRDGPHVHDDPPVCHVCATWGSPPLPGGNGCCRCGGDETS